MNHQNIQDNKRTACRTRLGKEWLFWDGGMGTLLQAEGLAAGELPEGWNLTHPEVISAIHRDYLAAGCQVINTNTFGANHLKYPDNLEEVVRAGVRLAVETRDKTAPGAYVALDIGPCGRLLAPFGDLPFEEAVSLFAEVVRIGKDGADLILIETMSDTYETKAAVLAAKENADLPIVVTNVYDGTGKLLTGGSVEAAAALLEGLGVDAFGLNCGLGPSQMAPLLARLNDVSSLPLVVCPNAGLPRVVDGKTVYDLSPADFAEEMEKLARIGLQAAGGCCGTTPDFLRETIVRLKNIPFRPNTVKNRSVVSSYAKVQELTRGPVLIGERINPNGREAAHRAAEKGDVEALVREGLTEEDEGADLLDVNVALPKSDEALLMEQTVCALQSVCALPLSLDTASPEALEKALRVYNGKALINSVNGSEKSMEAVFPLVKKYGGAVVALPFDENGIPKEAEGRLKVAEKILRRAADFGIDRRDILIDGLTLTAASQNGSAAVTLETLRLVKKKLGCGTILGVSNISFGLPRRELLTSHFLSMALESGLSCAICDPGSAPVQAAFASYRALMGQDEKCLDYIRRYAGTEETAQAPARSGEPADSRNMTLPLEECVIRGLGKGAAEAAAELIRTQEPVEVIDSHLIPALDQVGRSYEAGELFLPQLLMSADAARAAFDVLKASMKQEKKGGKGPVILATVQGDIHDIGKNIVRVVMENYGFEILDLGKDVPPERIVREALSRGIRLVGLSALMTTTVISMEETIRQLHIYCPQVKVMVGGAVLTKDYADRIGADFYGKDAMASVRYAESLFDGKETV